MLRRSEEEPSLCELVQRWLERTPGLEENSYNFWARYQKSVGGILEGQKCEAEASENADLKAHLLNEYHKKKVMFESIFDVSIHNALVARGERRFSHKALQVMPKTNCNVLVVWMNFFQKFRAPFWLRFTEMSPVSTNPTSFCPFWWISTRWSPNGVVCSMLGPYLWNATDSFILTDNHVMLVQRMIGSQQLGTGGSSGYQYLRSTLR